MNLQVLLGKSQYNENETYSGIKCVLGNIIFSKWHPLIKKQKLYFLI